MKFWYKDHHYNSQIKHTTLDLRHWWNIKGLAKALWHGEKYLTWFGHEDDCCDYWTPVHLSDGSINPKVKRAFIQDDLLALQAKEANDE